MRLSSTPSEMAPAKVRQFLHRSLVRSFVLVLRPLTQTAKPSALPTPDGFAFVPPYVPPDTLGCRTGRGERDYNLAVSDKANVSRCRDFFTAVKCRT
jgi:hypothetical protein